MEDLLAFINIILKKNLGKTQKNIVYKNNYYLIQL